MKVFHPDFQEPQSLKALEKYHTDGMYTIIPECEQQKLYSFLQAFEDYRDEKKEKITNSDLYPDLPFSINDDSWKSKRLDIDIIDKICKNLQGLNILDIGGWNGWLSNYLSRKGHHLVTTDIFSDEFDGLRAKKHYNEDFITLQLLPDELWRIEASFDLIIFNRNWAYIPNKEKVFSMAEKLLSENGRIIFTGLTFYRKTYHIQQHVEAADFSFRNKYGMPLLYFPTKGYLDHTDYLFFKNRLKLYPYNRFKYCLKKLFLCKAASQFAIYQKK